VQQRSDIGEDVSTRHNMHSAHEVAMIAIDCVVRKYANDSWAPNHRNSWALVQVVELGDDAQLREWLASVTQDRRIGSPPHQPGRCGGARVLSWAPECVELNAPMTVPVSWAARELPQATSRRAARWNVPRHGWDQAVSTARRRPHGPRTGPSFGVTDSLRLGRSKWRRGPQCLRFW
jgi:hypothetical protein